MLFFMIKIGSRILWRKISVAFCQMKSLKTPDFQVPIDTLHMCVFFNVIR